MSDQEPRHCIILYDQWSWIREERRGHPLIRALSTLARRSDVYESAETFRLGEPTPFEQLFPPTIWERLRGRVDVVVVVASIRDGAKTDAAFARLSEPYEIDDLVYLAGLLTDSLALRAVLVSFDLGDLEVAATAFPAKLSARTVWLSSEAPDYGPLLSFLGERTPTGEARLAIALTPLDGSLRLRRASDVPNQVTIQGGIAAKNDPGSERDAEAPSPDKTDQSGPATANGLAAAPPAAYAAPEAFSDRPTAPSESLPPGSRAAGAPKGAAIGTSPFGSIVALHREAFGKVRSRMESPRDLAAVGVDAREVGLADFTKQTSVELGVGAPKGASPGEQFEARFTAYHPSYRRQASEQLGRAGMRPRLDLLRTLWKVGTPVEVRPSGQWLVAEQASGNFIWDGQICELRFLLSVSEKAPTPVRTQIVFDAYIENVRVARVCVPINVLSRWSLSSLLRSRRHVVVENAYATAYASYALADEARVLDRTDALRDSAGWDWHLDCLDKAPNEPRKSSLEQVIANRDVFVLFWSSTAAQSEAVSWEWHTALKKPGLEAMQTQRLTSGPPLPPELEIIPNVTQRIRSHNMNRRYFYAGCACASVAIGFAIWSFKLGTLTHDQRAIVNVFLSVFSGIAAGLFTGSMTVKSKGFMPGIVVAATGGFGVWLLTTFVLMRNPGAFDVTVQPYGPGGKLDTLRGGTVRLQVGRDLRQETIGANGQAHFSNIPQEFDGKAVDVGVTAPGVSMYDSNQTVTLAPGAVLGVQVKRSP